MLFLWPLVVEVRCARQSPPDEGQGNEALVVEVRCARQSPPDEGQGNEALVVDDVCRAIL